MAKRHNKNLKTEIKFEYLLDIDKNLNRRVSLFRFKIRIFSAQILYKGARGLRGLRGPKFNESIRIMKIKGENQLKMKTK